MPESYSDDRRALEACDVGARPGVVAERFRIGRSSVCLRLKQRREEGRDRPKKMDGGPSSVIREAVEPALKRLTARAVPFGQVESDNHLTLEQHRDKLAEASGIRVHPWTVGRAPRRLRLTRKKEDAARRRAGRGRACPSAAGVAR